MVPIFEDLCVPVVRFNGRLLHLQVLDVQCGFQLLLVNAPLYKFNDLTLLI